MIQPISIEQWNKAQTAELTATSYEPDISRCSYELIFQYLGITFESFRGRFVSEIGCGAYPAISFCDDCRGVVYEPLYFDSLSDLAAKARIIWYQRAFENAPHPPRSGEVWLFNCLQHVIDPDLVVSKAKEIAPVIRFFEPVDYPTCIYHPHSPLEEDFKRWFGESVQRYTDRVPGFFDADCCYGTWRADA